MDPNRPAFPVVETENSKLIGLSKLEYLIIEMSKALVIKGFKGNIGKEAKRLALEIIKSINRDEQ